MTTKLIAYIRVSTKKQEVSGLGVDAQRESVRAFARSHDGRVIAEFQETESGTHDDRPELRKAINRAKRTRASLLVAKLDRVSRKQRFFLELYESGVDVLFCDIPTIPPGPIGKNMLASLAGYAELEAGLISERTKAALAAYKAGKHVSKRVRLQYPNGVPANVIAERGGLLGAALPECRDNLTREARAKGQKRGTAANLAAANEQVIDLGTEAANLRQKGLTLKAIADVFNDEDHQFKTRRNKPWTHVAVLRLLNRVALNKKGSDDESTKPK